MKRLFCTASAILILTLPGGCRHQQIANQEPFFPQSNEVEGWSKTSATRIFEAADLWRYINGDAEKYRKAGVQRTLTSDYRYRDTFDALADIHVMATREGARQIFEGESPRGSIRSEVGDAGRLYEGSLIFLKGRYLVRLVAYGGGPEAATAIEKLARGLETKISSTGGK